MRIFILLIFYILSLIYCFEADDDYFSAARSGDVSIIQSYIDKGVNIHSRDSRGNSAILIASGRGQVEVVMLLMHAGASVEDTSQGGLFDGKSTLMWASSQGRPETVRALVSAGAKVERSITKGVFLGKTALQWAASQGRAEVVRILLASGANIDHSADVGNFIGKTALSWACSQGRYEAVQVLLESGADVHSVDSEGVTPLMWAAGSEGSGDNSDINKGLMQKREKGSILVQVLRLLIAYGAEVDARDHDGITALMYAAFHGHTGVAQELMRAGADNSFRNKEGQTALQLAIAGEHMESADMIRKVPDILELSKEDLQAVPVSGWLTNLMRGRHGPQPRRQSTVSVSMLRSSLMQSGLDLYMWELLDICTLTSVTEVAKYFNLPNFGFTMLAATQLKTLVQVWSVCKNNGNQDDSYSLNRSLTNTTNDIKNITCSD